MPDITMCDGTLCARKDTCYRHTATEDKYGQAFFVTPPLDADGGCQSYWPTRAKHETQDIQAD